MHRIRARVVLLLVLGAATTVTVASVIALTVNPSSSTRTVQDYPYWETRTFASAAAGRADSAEHWYRVFWRDSVGSRWYGVVHVLPDSRPADPPPDRDRPPRWVYEPDRHHEATYTVLRGWPMLAMRQKAQINRGTWSIADGAHLGTYKAGNWAFPRVLPLRPLAVGFIVNTVIFAAAWWVALLVLRVHRRTIRKWQGHCPSCNYDLLGDVTTGCSECGWGRS